jgi:lysozyme
VLRVYDDKQPKVVLTADTKILGTLTAGYGHTGPELTWGLAVTQSMADLWFISDAHYKSAVPLTAKIGQVIVDLLTDNQYSALCDFVFNLGTGNPQEREWTIWDRLKAKQFDQVPLEMAKFVNWEGQKSIGLVRRRNAEVELWATGEPGTVMAPPPPSSVTQTTPTPPTQSDPVALIKKPTFITSVVSAGAAGTTGLVSVASQGQDIASKFADHSRVATHALEIFGTVGFAAALAVPIFIWLKDRQLKS